ncbi:chemotaxis protein CheC [Ralstonia pickettii]|uniref:chemotaxis protein CheC n=1 Tax=Ralstonia pickettii TaxID=329 RepID=UPI00046AAEEC|nr:chemotaxis protein CheC [Ralstonia pickettii]
MNDLTLNEDQRDALQEIANIGMGKAGAALAELLGAFVTLSVPGIKLVNAAQLKAELLGRDMAGDAPSPVRQAFQSDISGEAIVLFGKDGREELEELMGYGDADVNSESEALSDIANLLVGACVQSVFEQLGRNLSFSRPSFVPAAAIQQALSVEQFHRWDVALLLEVRFTLERGGFVAQLVMLLPETAIRKMKHALEQFLQAL